MKFLFVVHAAASIILAAGLYWEVGPEAALSFFAGACLAFVNLVVIAVTWTWILTKKLVALSTFAIVFKFAILGWIIWELVASGRIQIGWFGAGLAVTVLSVLSMTLRKA